MRLETDLHIHTIASGHGYSTIKEIVEASVQRGLKLVAITDHGLKMPGAPHLYHFTNMISVPRFVDGIEILRGVEANILDGNGNIDLPEEVLSSYLDVVLAGFHDHTGYTGITLEQNTEAMIQAINNPYVHIISHPGNPQYPVDAEAVVVAAKLQNKAIELNNYTFISRPQSSANCLQFARLAKKHNVMVAINSDAHICYNVGLTQQALNLALDAGIRRSQILNISAQNVHDFLDSHKRQVGYLQRA